MNIWDSLPKPFFVLAPMDDVTDTVFRQIIASLPYPVDLSGVQGAAEERSKTYQEYVDRAPQVATLQSAKNSSRVDGSAGRSAAVVGGYGPDLFFTEFVNVDGLQSAGREKLLPKLRFTDKERPIIAQIWGKTPENYYKTAQQLADGTLQDEATWYTRRAGLDKVQGSKEKRTNRTDSTESESRTRLTPQFAKSSHGVAGSASEQVTTARMSGKGYNGIDINMGCPVKAVVRDGCCIALIHNRELVVEIIQATKEGSGSLPISVKTRLGFSEVDLTWHEFLLEQKLNALSIHGRTKSQMSKVPADWAKIGEIRQLRDKISPATKIIGNGDVMTRAQGLELAKTHGLDGIMIGRGIFDDPFVFAKDSPWQDYTQQQKIDLYRQHVELFAHTWKNSERRIPTLNKFCKIYISGFNGAKELRERLMNANDIPELLTILK